MGLEAVAVPDSESELAFAVCLLQAHGIPHFVHGGAFGALLPGLQIAGYNARCIMVPAAFADEAREVLVDVAPAGESAAVSGTTPPSARSTWRIVLEVLLAGWFVPRRDGTAR